MRDLHDFRCHCVCHRTPEHNRSAVAQLTLRRARTDTGEVA